MYGFVFLITYHVYLNMNIWTWFKQVKHVTTRDWFHQQSTYSFYARWSQKRKKILMIWLSSYALGWVDFTKVLRAAYTSADPKIAKKDSQVISVFLHFWNLLVQKLPIKHWWNLPQAAPKCVAYIKKVIK